MGAVIEQSVSAKTPDRLLDKWAVEERTSLDITTIYRKIKSGTFPQPVRIGLRRVAWRESDIATWQSNLAVGVRRG
jgi:prophage regulatory protein